jgi:hypothetical protein
MEKLAEKIMKGVKRPKREMKDPKENVVFTQTTCHAVTAQVYHEIQL